MVGGSVDNRTVAAVFEEMADLLEIQGGDAYRARAFRRTAKILDDLREPVARTLGFGKLDAVPGIGPGSVGRIKEILRSGTCADHQRLTRALPPGLRDILAVKGIGPRTARIVYRHLGIASLDALEAAARTGMLARLPGITDKGQTDIIVAIEMHRSKPPRQLLPTALEIGAHMVGQLCEHPSVAAAVQCGSARRRTATVGDLDLVAGCDDRQATVSCFVTLPEVERVWMRGDGRASVRLASGQQMDLWTVTPSAYGAGIAAFTNGIRHNIAIRMRATKRGLAVSEHGVFDEATERLVRACPTERDLYDALGLALMPPEIREDQGEIELAEQNRLPTLVEMHDMRGDFQVHTGLGAGSASLEEMARAAKRAGRAWICVTDRWDRVASDAVMDTRERERAEVRERVGVDVLLGVEVDIRPDGSLALPAERLRHFDWVTASIDEEPGDDPPDVTERLIKAVETGVVDCLGHPRGRRLLVHDGFALDVDRVAKAALRHDAVLELNGDPARLDLDDLSARHCRDLGVKLALSSDARSPAELDNLRWAVTHARRGWLRARDVLNSLTWEDVRDRRKDKAASVPRARSVDPGEKEGPSPAATSLLARLSQGVDDELKARIEAYVKAGADPELEDALRALSDNPLQAAFNLLMKAAGPQILE